MNYTVSDFRRDIRRGNYGDGGYPLFFLLSDGEALHPDCAQNERRDIVRAIAEQSNDGWRVVGHDVNWEDPELHCAQCSKRIESAYAEDFVTRKGEVDGEACFVCLADASISILDRSGANEEAPYTETLRPGKGMLMFRRAWKPRAYVDGKPLLIPVDTLDADGYVVRSEDAIPQWGAIGAEGSHGARYKLICWRD